MVLPRLKDTYPTNYDLDRADVMNIFKNPKHGIARTKREAIDHWRHISGFSSGDLVKVKNTHYSDENPPSYYFLADFWAYGEYRLMSSVHTYYADKWSTFTSIVEAYYLGRAIEGLDE